MKSVVITGGAGFIGSHLSERFAQEGYHVIIIDNLFRGKRSNVERLLTAGHLLLEYDLADHNSVELVREVLIKYRPAYILHYAAINGTQYFYDIPEKVAEVNSIGTYNLLTALVQACMQDKSLKPVIVFASTSETYGEPLRIPTEEMDLTYARISEDRDSYAIAKMMSEFYVKLYAKRLGLDYLIFRIFNVYGPRMVGTKYGQVIPEFIQRLSDGEYPLSILGDGQHTRSFIYIDDHVSLTFSAVLRAKRNEVYNLGNPQEITIKALAELVMKKMGLEPRLKFLGERSGDHKRRVPNIEKLLNEIGRVNFVPLEKGIEKMLESLPRKAV